jgi:hypothetical protein
MDQKQGNPVLRRKLGPRPDAAAPGQGKTRGICRGRWPARSAAFRASSAVAPNRRSAAPRPELAGSDRQRRLRRAHRRSRGRAGACGFRPGRHRRLDRGADHRSAFAQPLRPAAARRRPMRNCSRRSSTPRLPITMRRRGPRTGIAPASASSAFPTITGCSNWCSKRALRPDRPARLRFWARMCAATASSCWPCRIQPAPMRRGQRHPRPVGARRSRAAATPGRARSRRR